MSVDVLEVLKLQSKAWRKGFLGYLLKQRTINDNPYSFYGKRNQFDEWALGRATARKWVDGEF